MPLIIPTPDEVHRMGRRERDLWRKRMGITLADAATTRRLLANRTHTETEADLWADIYGTDPNAAQHSRELMENTK